MLIANCCENDVLPHVLPFVKENIKNDDWKIKDAAVMAFGEFPMSPSLEKPQIRISANLKKVLCVHQAYTANS